MKRRLVIAAVAASVVIGGGAAAAFADDSTGSGGGTSTRAGKTSVTHSSAADAVSAALKHTPGTGVAADRDDDGGGAWEVDVVKGDGTEYTVRVSPGTGRVLGAHPDNDDDGREDLSALKGTSVDAREAALAAASKGTVAEIDLDDDGPAAWSVETAKGEWKVDAHTGRVTQDRDDEGQGDDD